MSDPRRDAVVAEAESWLGTPFHHQARIKGVGVDCGNFQLGVYEALGHIPHVDVPYYPPDWAMHRDEEWFLSYLTSFSTEYEGPPAGRTPEPGDLVIFQFGRLYSHGAIVAPAWPRLIHAYWRIGKVCRGDAGDALLAYRRDGSPRLRRFFTRF
ncbi:MAG TPA: hydrolase [Stellaceae bacterium]|nr:hydrolase [Stellaceae bacterium]